MTKAKEIKSERIIEDQTDLLPFHVTFMATRKTQMGSGIIVPAKDVEDASKQVREMFAKADDVESFKIINVYNFHGSPVHKEILDLFDDLREKGANPEEMLLPSMAAIKASKIKLN